MVKIQLALSLFIFVYVQTIFSQSQPGTFTVLPDKVIVGYWNNSENASAPFLDLDEVDIKYNVINVSSIVTLNGDGYTPVFIPYRTRYATDAEFITDIQLVKDQAGPYLFP